MQPIRLITGFLTVGIWTFASRILGFVRDMVFVRYFGASAATDAFFLAFKIPNFMRRLFAGGGTALDAVEQGVDLVRAHLGRAFEQRVDAVCHQVIGPGQVEGAAMLERHEDDLPLAGEFPFLDVLPGLQFGQLLFQQVDPPGALDDRLDQGPLRCLHSRPLSLGRIDLQQHRLDAQAGDRRSRTGP